MILPQHHTNFKSPNTNKSYIRSDAPDESAESPVLRSPAISRRRFLRLPLLALSALLPATAIAQSYPYEPDTEQISSGSLNKRVMFLENERIFSAITDQWQTFNIKAMLKCFHGCGIVPERRYRV